MHELRADARRACTARRERASVTPARLTFPLLSAALVLGAVAATSSAAGLSLGLVLAITVLVAVVGACVARRTVGSVLSGATLLLVRPYSPGEQVRLYLPMHGVIDAELVRVGLANTTLATSDGLLVVPNSRLLRGLPQRPDADLR
jgi:small-conductance mechanosensitive channel